MKCLILAAGYATRLYPLTENYPKPLLKVGNKPILNWLLDDITQTRMIDDIILVSNHKFADTFKRWAEGLDYGVAVLDDGTETNETRLGAVKDISFAINTLGIDDDLLVIAGDNLNDFSFKDFIRYANEKGTSCIMRYFEPDISKLRKAGVIRIDDEDRILHMVEKPEVPESNWCTPPYYIYSRDDLKLVDVGIRSGCGTDAPGSFIAWLSTVVPVHAYLMPGNRYDVGDLESYKEVQETFKGIKY